MICALDTNIFINVMNKESGYEDSKKILDWIDDGEIKGIVSTIVLAEICSGYGMMMKEKDDFLGHILGSANYEIVDVTVPVAMDAGRLRATKGLRLPDALIVVSAERHAGEFLITNDDSMQASEELKVITSCQFVKHFEGKAKQKKGESGRNKGR